MDVLLKREWRRWHKQDNVPTAQDVQSGAAKLIVTLDDVGEKLICSTATEVYRITPDKVTNHRVGGATPAAQSEGGNDPAYDATVRDCIKAWLTTEADIKEVIQKGPQGNLTADELRAELHLLVEGLLKTAHSTFNSAEVQHDEAEEEQLRSMSVSNLTFALAIKEILSKRSQSS
jgi:hypothetical protein